MTKENENEFTYLIKQLDNDIDNDNGKKNNKNETTEINDCVIKIKETNQDANNVNNSKISKVNLDDNNSSLDSGNNLNVNDSQRKKLSTHSAMNSSFVSKFSNVIISSPVKPARPESATSHIFNYETDIRNPFSETDFLPVISGIQPSKRANIIMELYTTERSYVRDLDLMIALYKIPLQDPEKEVGSLLNQDTIRAIFNNITSVYDVNFNLLTAIKDRLSDNWDPDCSTIGDIILEHLPMFTCYTVYCNGYVIGLDLITEEAKKKKELKSFLMENQKKTIGRTIESFLILPVQRIPRYVLLIRDLLDNTPKDHADFFPLTIALENLEETAKLIDYSLQESESKKIIKNLKKKVVGLKDIEKEGRTLLKEGTISLMKIQHESQMILFNDLIVFATKNAVSNGNYTIEYVLDLNAVWCEDLKDLDPQTVYNDALDLYTPDRPYTVYVGTEKEKIKWINAIESAMTMLLDDPEIRTVKYHYSNGAKYVGTMKESRRHGRGKFTSSDQTIYEGEFIDDLRCGNGRQLYATGEEYDGQWLNNLPHGTGVLKINMLNTYTGEWRNGEKHGKGVIVYANGDRFEGQFLHDEICGYGVLECSNSASYKGYWKQSLMHGKGRFVKDGNEYYEGEFVDGGREGKGFCKTLQWEYKGEWFKNMKHGSGKFLKRSGLKYEGGFEMDNMHGEGKMKYENGDVYVGGFLAGEKHGPGSIVYALGASYEGEWKNDLKHGLGTMHYANGGKYKGEFATDKRDGRGEMKYADGTEYDGFFKNDVRCGKGTCNFPDGSVYQGDWFNDQMHGHGCLDRSNNLESGTFCSTFLGKKGIAASVKYVGGFRYNRKHGEGLMITPMGQYEGGFCDGSMHGSGIYRDCSGTVYEGIWRMGCRIGTGKLGGKVVTKYKDGRLVFPGQDIVAPQLKTLYIG